MIKLEINKVETIVECQRCKSSMENIGEIPFRIGGMDGGTHPLLGG